MFVLPRLVLCPSGNLTNVVFYATDIDLVQELPAVSLLKNELRAIGWGRVSLSSDSPSGTAGSITTRGMALKPRHGAIGGKRNEHPRCGRYDRPGHRRPSPS